MHTQISAAVIAAFLTSHARAASFFVGADPRPGALGGRVVTDAYDDATTTFLPNVRHFAYTLGLSAGNPYFTSDPGFNAVVGSGLPAGQQLRFDIVRHLSRWDGLGTVRFADVPNNESVRFQFGAATATVTGATDAVSGFAISNIASGGSLHRHLNAFLQGGADNLAPPASGVYFTAMRLAVSGGSLIHSDAIYIAYNNGLADADFRRGLDYLANPIPGDANFDGAVGFADLAVLAQHYGGAGDASFFDGDFDGDRDVGFSDLAALAQRYGQGTSLSTSDFSSDWALARSFAAGVTPEPTSVCGSYFVMAGLFRRRRDI